MIPVLTSTKVWIACGVTDMRKGFAGLSALTETALERDPYYGGIFTFVVWPQGTNRPPFTIPELWEDSVKEFCARIAS